MFVLHINMHFRRCGFQMDDAKSMGFISTYALAGNEAKINVQEYYKDLAYPVSGFEEFKKVINTSPDFNKVILVPGKK